VPATLTAGLVIGNVGWLGAIASASRGHIKSFWEYVAFLANSIVFILIGGNEAGQAGGLLAPVAAAAIGLVLLGRVVAVYPLCALFARSHRKIDVRHQHVLVWGSLRGALALALALAIPASVSEKHAIITAAFAVVAFSIFAQGLTMPWLIRILGLTRATEPLPDEKTIVTTR
jgi:CPA1 family monovalent cation:H+ antiporter